MGDANRLRLGISSCLLGNRVRYDGDDKKDPELLSVFQNHTELVGICPEVGAGMGVPRPPIQLVERQATINAVGVDDATFDATPALSEYTNATLPALHSFDGYLFKARSPSCGVVDTPIQNTSGQQRYGAGLFAAAVSQHYPFMPLCDECRIVELDVCLRFIDHCFAYQTWRKAHTYDHSPSFSQCHSKLLGFHRNYQTRLQAYDETGERQLRQWLNTLRASDTSTKALIEQYGLYFFDLINTRVDSQTRCEFADEAALSLMNKAQRVWNK